MLNEEIQKQCDIIIESYKNSNKTNYRDYLLELLTYCKTINAELYNKTKDKRILEHGDLTENYIRKESKNKQYNLHNISELTEQVLKYYWLYDEILDGKKIDG